MTGYFIYRLVQWIAMTFPKWFAYKVAIAVAGIFYLFRWRMRRTLVDNLRHAFPEKKDAVIYSYARLTFCNFGKYLVDFFRFDKFDRQAMEREVTIAGQEHVEECLEKGKGLITVTAHLGNWELGGVVMALLGYKFNVVALSHESSKVDSIFVRQRENKGVRVIPLGRAAARCVKALRQNELIALLGDRNINETGVKVPFLNGAVFLPRGPATLSIHMDAPIMPGFLVRTEDDKFRLILEKPIYDTGAGDKEERIKKLTGEVVKVIGNYIRQYPGQWYMFYPV